MLASRSRRLPTTDQRSVQMAVVGNDGARVSSPRPDPDPEPEPEPEPEEVAVDRTCMWCLCVRDGRRRQTPAFERVSRHATAPANSSVASAHLRFGDQLASARSSAALHTRTALLIFL